MTSWDDLFLAFFHDPPDKVLQIPKHENRAARYVTAALGREVTDNELGKGWAKQADIQAAVAERLPMPTVGEQRQRAVDLENGRLLVRHPLSGAARCLEGLALDEDYLLKTIETLVEGVAEPRQRFLLVWRLLPEKLAEKYPWFAHLPAETRLPDHTIWHHLDTAAGLHQAHKEGHNMAFLSFFLGPVQEFIAAARSLRDLWSGSAILSWLTFSAMLPVIESWGPTAIIYPSLRGLPLMDLWLLKNGLAGKVKEPGDEALRSPCLPNRFLAVGPYGDKEEEAKKLAEKCEQSVRQGWNALAQAVREELVKNSGLGEWPKPWLKRWNKQIESFFEIRTAVLPWGEAGDEAIARLFGHESFADAFSDAAAVRALAKAMPDGERPSIYKDKPSGAGRWQARVELSSRLMEAQRAIRHIPPFIYIRPETIEDGHIHKYGPKCTLLGSYEQIGPEDLAEARQFWEEMAKKVNIQRVRLRKGERFCAIALAKRFAAPAFLASQLGLNAQKLRFPDTATVAAACWLKEAGLDPEKVRQENDGQWSGNWLHWPRQDFDQDEDPAPQKSWKEIQEAKNRIKVKPPTYFAVLKLDADWMGKWLRGENAPKVEEVLHPKTKDYFQGLSGTKKGLEAKRPVSPALHAAISEALTNFAVHIVPKVVAKHKGVLIYAGGDDVLALLPARTALACARELQLAFRGETSANNGAAEGYYRQDGRDLLVMGPKATLSAGIVVVHYKEDLRLALNEAREAEKAAKAGGRDALQLRILRRSGEHSQALCAWPAVDQIEKWVKAFEEGASDRWAYHLCADLQTLTGLPVEAMAAEIRRQANRAEEKTRRLLGETDVQSAGEALAKAFREYRAERQKQAAKVLACSPGTEDLNARVLEDFLTLVQSASFLARGREGE